MISFENLKMNSHEDDHGLEIVKVFGDTAIKGKVHCLLFTSRKKKINLPTIRDKSLGTSSLHGGKSTKFV